MRVIRERATELEVVDGMEIGTRLVLRGGSLARQSSSSLVCPLIQASVSSAPLFSPCYLSFCHPLPFSLSHFPLSLEPDCESPPLAPSLATSVLILSVSAQ